MKSCEGGYIRRGVMEGMFRHQYIVFDENASIAQECPLCRQLIWHEETGATLRAAEVKIGELVNILHDHNLEHHIP